MNEMQKGTEKSINYLQMSKEWCFPLLAHPLTRRPPLFQMNGRYIDNCNAFPAK